MYLPSEVYYLPAVFRIFFWVLTGFFFKESLQVVEEKTGTKHGFKRNFKICRQCRLQFTFEH